MSKGDDVNRVDQFLTGLVAAAVLLVVSWLAYQEGYRKGFSQAWWEQVQEISQVREDAMNADWKLHSCEMQSMLWGRQ
jgi:hypothetical protein